MDKSDVLDTMFDARSALTDLIVELSPDDAGQRAQLNALMQKRDAVNAAIRSVIDAQFSGIAQDPKLSQAVAGLSALTGQLAAVQKTIEKIGDVVDIASKVVGAVVDIVKIVMALV